MKQNNFIEEKNNLIKEILKLKEEKGYTIIAHNYQIPEIQDIADHTGDSLALAKLATTLDSKKILFCGVDFMAETLKILNPEKQILIPRFDATCPMANSLDEKTLVTFKKNYPDYSIVLYVNSTAHAKMYADTICTSANAVEVVQKLNNNNILFGPDKNLASYIKEKTSKNIIPIPGDTGFCYVHNNITLNDLKEAKQKHPDAKIIVHPECSKEVRDASDYTGSTGQMVKFPENTNSKEFIIGTEIGMVYKLQKIFPDKLFYPLKKNFICHNMKKNTLIDLYNTLKEEVNFIELDADIVEKAKKPILNMFKLMEK